MAEGMAGRAALRLTTRAATAQPATLDEAAREVEVVWSTGARAWNYIPGQGYAWEELDMSANAIRMDRLASGDAPVLDGHQGYEAEHVLGRVVSARLEGGVGIARLRFSGADDVRSTWAKITDGTLRTVSVGYRIHGYEKSTAEDGRVLIRATDWEPFEISVVPIPADAGATVRGTDLAEPPAALATAASAAEEQHMTDQVETAAPDVPAAVDVVTERAAVQADRARIAALDEPARQARTRGLPESQVAALVARARDEGHDAAWLRGELFGALVSIDQARGTPAPVAVSQFGRSYEDPAVIVEAMATAIAARHMPSVAAKAGEGQWRNFAGLRPSDMLMELAQARGERVGPRDRDRLIARAFHTSSDFPLLLASAGNKMLETGYALAAPSYRRFFARRRFNDFKAHSFLTAGDFPSLAQLNPGGEITRGTISEKREQITPASYARGVAVTRQMLVNDDLGAFADFGTMIGRRIADWENATAYAVVNTASGDGPTLVEGSAAVFGTAAGRANKASSATTVTATALGLGFNAMKSQTSLDGLKLNIQPRYLVCSVVQEFVASQFASSSVIPSTAGGVNVFSGRYEVVSDANIPSNRWYLFADPDAAPVYVYGYVGENEVPQVRVGQPMGVDGTVVEVVHDFAVGAIDYRGGYFNSGAAPA